MLFVTKEKAAQVLENRAEVVTHRRRKRQQNIKVSEDCQAAFEGLAKALGVSRASLFEDMVAERLEALDKEGVKSGGGSS